MGIQKAPFSNSTEVVKSSSMSAMSQRSVQSENYKVSAEETTSAYTKAKSPSSARKPKATKVKNTKKSNTKNEKKINVNGHTVTLSNQEKIYWPVEGITKGDLVNYYNTMGKY